MVRTSLIVPALLFALSAVAAPARDVGGETITYRYEPGGLCLGCATYTITLDPEGAGRLETKIVGAAARNRYFAATRSDRLAFTRRLERYRPHGEVLFETGAPCGNRWQSDGSTIDINWQTQARTSAHLRFYSECRFPGSEKMFAVVAGAPRLLPIAGSLPMFTR